MTGKVFRARVTEHFQSNADAIPEASYPLQSQLFLGALLTMIQNIGPKDLFYFHDNKQLVLWFL